MNILFYNLYNIGDTYFSQPFVSNIVKNNPTCTFFLFCKFNHYIFENINKLEILKDIDNYNLLIINNNKPYFLINDNLLLINTWAGAHRDIDNNVFDSDLVNLTKQYYKCINNINKEFNLNIKYNTELTLPKLPDINIDKILEFKNKCYKSNKDSKFLFYYKSMFQ